MPTPPESYHLSPTPHVPNSRLPALVYRAVLPNPNCSVDATLATIEPNRWRKGGVFKTYKTHHFHSVTHECYAVFRGQNRMLLGRGPGDDEEMGWGEGEGEGEEWKRKRVVVGLREGDIIVLPAGVSHCSLDSNDDFEYVGLYPEGSPKWDNNWCKADPMETTEKADVARAVLIPEYDPIYGRNGPLVDIWKKANGQE